MFHKRCLAFTVAVLLVDCIFSNDENIDFTIGALLSSDAVISQFNQSVESVRTRVNGKIITFSTITELLSSNALTASKQFCRMLAARNGRLFALVVSNPPHAPNSPPLSVSFIAALYGIPVIGVSSRHAIFSDKYAHSSFLRTVPPYSQEAQVWLELIVHFGWHEIVLIHSDGQEAKALLSQLESQEQAKAFKITRTVAVNTDEEDIVSYNELYRLLDPVRTGQTRSIFLFVTRKYSEHIIDVASRMGLFGKEWAWVFSEQCIGAKNLPQGILSARLTHPEESHHVDDAARVATQGILNLLRREPDAMLNVQSVKSCDQNLNFSEPHGNTLRDPSLGWFIYLPKLYKTMVSLTLEDGRTGHVQFNSQGDRVGSVYDIVNAQIPVGNQAHCRTRSCTPSLVPVGTYGFPQKLDDPSPSRGQTAHLSIDVARIQWPGNYRLTAVRKICLKYGKRGECVEHVEREVAVAPPSFKRKTHLKVVTIQSTPFVNHVLKLPGMSCNTSDRPDVLKAQVDCSHTNTTTGKVTEYCCYGYCIDLLRRLANRTGLQANPTTFTFDLHLVGDGQMGEELTVNDTKVWNGIVGELVTGLADLAVAPMTITPERLTRIDFTKPFKYLGITMLVKRERSKSNLASFLQPFESTLWVLVGVSVNVVAFLLYILDHFSALSYLRKTKSKPNSPPPPTSVSTTSFTDSLHKNSLEASSEVGGKKTAVLANEQPQPAGSTASEDKFTLSSSMWFTWGILLNSGISEETPKAFSTRALGMVWAGFAMIIVASYTANLAAFLVLDRPEASISGIDDVRLRNPQRDFTFATVRGSPVELYFKSQVEYVTIYRTMEGRNVETVEEGIKAVKSGALKAFIWDSARLNYEASHDCELVTAGEVFGRTGYALAMKPGNPWLYELSQAVLSFHERGFMETLDTQWIFSSTEVCANTESSPATLELPNMAGVFIMVAVGIITGLLLLLIEIACDKRRREKKRQTDAVRKAGLHWRQKVQQRKVRLTDQKFNSHATSTLPTFVDECQKHKFSWPSSPIRPLSKMAKASSSPIEAILVPKTSLPSYACAPSSLPTSASPPQPLVSSPPIPPPPLHLQPTNGTESAAYQTGSKHCTQGPEAPNNQLYRSRMHPGVARPRRKFTRNVITAPVNFTASPKKNVRI